MSKLPSFSFYPGDWQKDQNLRRCSHAAKGVWIDMLCLMFECEERGVLASGGEPWSDEDVANAVGGAPDMTLSCIEELLAKGVVRRRQDGALFSARLVRDEQIRLERAKAGSSGGSKTQAKRKAKLKQTTKQIPEDEEEDEDEESPGLSLQDKKRIAAEIYRRYPRKAARGKAIDAIVKAMNRCEAREGGERPHEFLILKVDEYASSPSGQPPPPGCTDDFRPYPASWFNAERYDDDPSEWQKPNGTSARADRGATGQSRSEARLQRETADQGAEIIQPRVVSFGKKAT